MLLKRGLVLVAVLVATVPLAGCFGAPSPSGGPSTITLTDGSGANVTVHLPVNRIVSLTPSHTEVLFAIGAGHKVVGGTDFDNYPPEAAKLTHVLVNLQTNFELIVSLVPDIVFVSSLNAQNDLHKLRELNLTVFYADAYTVQDVAPMIELIGRATGEQANATAVANTLRAGINATAAKVAATPTRPRTFYLLDDFGAYWTSGSSTRGHDLVALAGGSNIFSNITGWATVSLESVAAADPEVIVLGLYVSLNATVMNESSPWSNMTAVRGGRVYRVPDADIVDRPGPRIAEGLEWMARSIHPEAFAS